MKDDNEMEENLSSIIEAVTSHIVDDVVDSEKKKELHDNMSEEEKAELWRRNHPVLARKTDKTIRKQLNAIRAYTPKQQRKDRFQEYLRLLRRGKYR